MFGVVNSFFVLFPLLGETFPKVFLLRDCLKGFSWETFPIFLIFFSNVEKFGFSHFFHQFCGFCVLYFLQIFQFLFGHFLTLRSFTF